MKGLDIITGILLIVGGLNWGLVGMIHLDLVATLFGDYSAASRIVYTVVGLSALYQAAAWVQIHKRREMQAVRSSR
jgi:hypothetical protein